jgi:hypothetical protein
MSLWQSCWWSLAGSRFPGTKLDDSFYRAPGLPFGPPLNLFLYRILTSREDLPFP